MERNVAVCNGPGEIWVKYPCWQQEWGALNHIESSPIGAKHQEKVNGGQTLPEVSQLITPVNFSLLSSHTRAPDATCPISSRPRVKAAGPSPRLLPQTHPPHPSAPPATGALGAAEPCFWLRPWQENQWQAEASRYEASHLLQVPHRAQGHSAPQIPQMLQERCQSYWCNNPRRGGR